MEARSSSGGDAKKVLGSGDTPVNQGGKKPPKRPAPSGAPSASEPPPAKKAKPEPKPKLTFEEEVKALMDREVKNCQAAIQRFREFKKTIDEEESNLEKLKTKSAQLKAANAQLKARGTELNANKLLLEEAEKEKGNLQTEKQALEVQNRALQGEITRIQQAQDGHICDGQWEEKYKKLSEAHKKLKDSLAWLSGPCD
ncbi:hypothetical protein PG984_005393 [Apiospora sp. TS-2023a]